MTIFDEYVEKILRANPQLTNLRPAVEKELFHQDILRLINDSGLMRSLVFMGGTCLRLCYGNKRLSEDLDFSTENKITQEYATKLSDTVRQGLSEKYGLPVTVKKPIKETDTETWKISIITNPGHSDIPVQQIHIDICHYKSYQKELRIVRNNYSTDNVAPLFVMAEKIEEILVDKLIAFAYRNRIKNRDLWDIYTLYCKNVELDAENLKRKLSDKKLLPNDFNSRYTTRMKEIQNTFPCDFNDEMSRFLSAGIYDACILSKHEGPAVFNTILSDYSKSFKCN